MNFKVDCKIYPRLVQVFASDTLEQAKQEYEKHYKTDLDVDITLYQALTCFPLKTSTSNTVIILFNKNSKTLLEDIHHETIHAATWILDNVGVPISQHNDEALTYLSSYIFTSIQAKLIEWKIKSKVNQVDSISLINNQEESFL